MWMINPKFLCRNHLVGEHVELHMLLGSLKKDKNIEGFIADKLVEPQSIQERHKELVGEMDKRGYNHKSELGSEDLKAIESAPKGEVDLEANRRELWNRCEKCRKRMKGVGDND